MKKKEPNVTDSTELAVVEQPQQLISIEPAEYVAQVFEPFAKRLADAKQLALSTTYDVKTTAGMATAVKIRATFRDIRVESEKARKIRKAPILEIGKLLDSRQKEIEAEIEPLELAPDLAIKAEEARKEAERQAKLAAEQQRIAFIRARIDNFRFLPASMVGRPSDEIGAVADVLSETVISLEEYQELSGDAQVDRNAAVTKLREMQAAQLAIEQEQARLTAEREQFARERAEAAEQARQAALERQRAEDEERIARARAQAAMLVEQQAHEARLRTEREAAEAELRKQREAEEQRLAEQRAELARQQAVLDAKRAEGERVERERQEAIEAAERAQREAKAETARVEAERIASEERAKEAERIRRLRVQFELNGPGDNSIVESISNRFEVSEDVAVRWLTAFDATAYLQKLGRNSWAA